MQLLKEEIDLFQVYSFIPISILSTFKNRSSMVKGWAAKTEVD
jgi:hypothetical protein